MLVGVLQSHADYTATVQMQCDLKSKGAELKKKQPTKQESSINICRCHRVNEHISNQHLLESEKLSY